MMQSRTAIEPFRDRRAATFFVFISVSLPWWQIKKTYAFRIFKKQGF